MNILLTCIGRRNYLVDYFKNVLNPIGGKVFVANNHVYSAGFVPADGAFLVPDIFDPSYIDGLINICKNYQIKAIIPLYDPELPILSKHRDRFLQQGIFPVISSPKIIEICDDKWETHHFLINSSINSPRTFLNKNNALKNLEKREIHYPLILKPRWGLGSIGIFEVSNVHELDVFYSKISGIIRDKKDIFIKGNNPKELILIQEKVMGDEYALDIINDLNGNYLTTIPKKKIAMRAGETDIAITVDNLELISLGEKIGRSLGHIGNLDVDLINADYGPVIIDMNARIGGGYPFSHLAGVNLPRAIISWLSGQPADPSDFNYKQDICGVKGIDPLPIDNKHNKTKHDKFSTHRIRFSYTDK
jgi:carbamoyl-phosphate synthase large subunit